MYNLFINGYQIKTDTLYVCVCVWVWVSEWERETKRKVLEYLSLFDYMFNMVGNCSVIYFEHVHVSLNENHKYLTQIFVLQVLVDLIIEWQNN